MESARNPPESRNPDPPAPPRPRVAARGSAPGRKQPNRGACGGGPTSMGSRATPHRGTGARERSRIGAPLAEALPLWGVELHPIEVRAHAKAGDSCRSARKPYLYGRRATPHRGTRGPPRSRAAWQNALVKVSAGNFFLQRNREIFPP